MGRFWGFKEDEYIMKQHTGIEVRSGVDIPDRLIVNIVACNPGRSIEIGAGRRSKEDILLCCTTVVYHSEPVFFGLVPGHFCGVLASNESREMMRISMKDKIFPLQGLYRAYIGVCGNCMQRLPNEG